ncbi:MAG: radical SAM protein [Acetobacteraceae bacterium]|nr:radical SAM protein [Acetobacteraceae bacterium]
MTNVCNAACDFCGFARDKGLAGPRRYMDADALARALPILHRRGIRFMTLQGGEPLAHPQITRLVSEISNAGIQAALITNGWFLPRDINSLGAAGLARLIVSIDSDNLAEHERNRGLDGLNARIKQGIELARAWRIPVTASVTVSRLVRYDRLPEALRRLGFGGVEFSYPRREPFGSTSLVYGGKSHLVDLSRDELLGALEAIRQLKRSFPVFNSTASLAEVARFVRGDPQHVPCVAGYKYFYLDWNLDIWRCEAWHEKLGSVFDLDHIPDQRDPCNACMMACYRNASVLMHSSIAASDALAAAASGDVAAAAATLFRRGVALSAWALVREAPQIGRLANRKAKLRPVRAAREIRGTGMGRTAL